MTRTFSRSYLPIGITDRAGAEGLDPLGILAVHGFAGLDFMRRDLVVGAERSMVLVYAILHCLPLDASLFLERPPPFLGVFCLLHAPEDLTRRDSGLFH